MIFILLCFSAGAIEQVTYEKWKQDNESIVIYYADWCTVSTKTLNTLESILSDFSIPSYKFEASKKSSELGIKSFPQIFYYKDTLALKYEDDKTEDKLKNWVSRRTSPQITIHEPIKSQLRVQEELCVSYPVCLVAKGLPLSLLQEISRRVDLEIISLEGPSSLLLYLDYSQKQIEYSSDLKIEEISSFLAFHMSPAMIPLERKHLDKLFNQGGKAVVLLRERRHKYYDNELVAIGDKLKGKAVLLAADVNEPLGKQVQDVLRIPDRVLPTVKFIECLGGSLNVTQFDMFDSISAENILNFFSMWERGELKPFVLGQEAPKKLVENRVVNIVQKTFKEIVLDSPEYVFVLFYAPWCSYSRSVLPIIEQLAYDMRNVKNLKIGKIDAYNNDIGKEVKGYPTIKLYVPQAGGKIELEFIEERTAKKISDFITSNVRALYSPDL